MRNALECSQMGEKRGGSREGGWRGNGRMERGGMRGKMGGGMGGEGMKGRESLPQPPSSVPVSAVGNAITHKLLPDAHAPMYMQWNWRGVHRTLLSVTHQPYPQRTRPILHTAICNTLNPTLDRLDQLVTSFQTHRQNSNKTGSNAQPTNQSGQTLLNNYQ